MWVAEGPAFTARQVTRYDRDDGQELTSLALSPDGRFLVLKPAVPLEADTRYSCRINNRVRDWQIEQVGDNAVQGYQDMGGRVTRYPLRSSEKTPGARLPTPPMCQ